MDASSSSGRSGLANDDDKTIKEGGVYNVGFAVHDDNITTRGHHVSFVKTLGFGIKADIRGCQASLNSRAKPMHVQNALRAPRFAGPVSWAHLDRLHHTLVFVFHHVTQWPPADTPPVRWAFTSVICPIAHRKTPARCSALPEQHLRRARRHYRPHSRFGSEKSARPGRASRWICRRIGSRTPKETCSARAQQNIVGP